MERREKKRKKRRDPLIYVWVLKMSVCVCERQKETEIFVFSEMNELREDFARKLLRSTTYKLVTSCVELNEPIANPL